MATFKNIKVCRKRGDVKKKIITIYDIHTYTPDTVCPRSSDPFDVVTYYMKWVTTSWTYSNIL